MMRKALDSNRTAIVKEIQALAWVAQASASERKPGGAWYRDAAHRGDIALASNSSDPALQATAAQLFTALPGGPEERSRWRKHAADLWQALASRFPANGALRAKAKESAEPDQPLAPHSSQPR